MLAIFTDLADWLTFILFGLSPNSKLGDAVHFFIEDTTKIFFLLVIMIYFIALLRASLNIERVRDYLAKKNRFIGYLTGSVFGAITPFCSCSSIPVFLGFTSAGIPVGITMSFLLTSPLINEVAVLLLLSLVGWQITLMYVLVGMAVGILGGVFLDLIRAEKMLQPFALKAYQSATPVADSDGDTAAKPTLSFRERHDFAKNELWDIFSRVWKWVFIGVGLGAALHGYVPVSWLEGNLGDGQWWSVPLAVLFGIPLYSNATGVIPIMESLITKGLPIGTTMAFCMSTVAASFPEFILLKQVMTWKLLAIILAMLLFSFTLVGWILNLVN
ncbi:permease [Marinomonas sp. ef1]|uniref:permease n=1 Tax=Marinomonas sp. ef1 TaxID=2005043 RepID=UPI000C28D4DA|nr:permease [Marinomonas sp. ef1]|tara:strand:+ start:3294 stop:4280 length:987 start_codon:yes stop_codon:yes gene_type:complete